MLFELVKTDSGFAPADKGLIAQAPSEIGLLESDIEKWLADKPKLLLPNEELLVIAQSVAGQSMADVLALDALGRLVIVEIKRHLSDRTVVGQLLEYAARLKSASFEELQNYARRYNGDNNFDLYAAFQNFAEGVKLTKEEFGREHRVFIVAPDSDANLRLIVDWLKSYNVPIEFVPFTIYADVQGGPRFLQFEGVVTSPELTTHDDSWAGHWIFNTNETHAPGAYERMFQKNVAAIYGYPNGPANLEGAAAGDKVFAYVNQQGLRAIGAVQDPQVIPGTGIFLDDEGNQQPDEYHLKVSWQVAPDERSITSSEAATQFGYNLPVRSVFAKLHRGSVALRLENELRSRAKS
jgi:hypothetical protein